MGCHLRRYSLRSCSSASSAISRFGSQLVITSPEVEFMQFMTQSALPDMVSVSVSRAKSTLYERSEVFCGEPTFCMASHCLNAISTARKYPCSL